MNLATNILNTSKSDSPGDRFVVIGYIRLIHYNIAYYLTYQYCTVRNLLGHSAK